MEHGRREPLNLQIIGNAIRANKFMLAILRSVAVPCGIARLLCAVASFGCIPVACMHAEEPDRAAAARQRVAPALERDLAAVGLRLGDPVFIRIFKEERVLELWMLRRDTGKYEMFRTWPVVKMSGHPGPKLAEGDMQAPEGFYKVFRRQMNPKSAFHLSFDIGFPNDYDRAHGRTGSHIMVHGNAVSAGCFAMTDPKIEEIYTLCDAALAAGQPFFRVHVFPFRMTAQRMKATDGSEWAGFWQNLREGYDIFGRGHIPPDARAEGGRYVCSGGV